ncbi:MAG: FAD-linked oxidase C-terminal domain-containing protein [Methyloligellaceae bacterium]
MSMIAMPKPDQSVLDNRSAIISALKLILPDDAVIEAYEELRAYECDALLAYKGTPMAVVLPRTTEQVSAIMKVATQFKVPVIPRGSGTSLAGGALPTEDSIVLGVGRMNQVLEKDYANLCVKVQTGVTNLGVTKAVEADGFFYAPDPSSQLACAIAGNIAMNSGGAHCLKYGVTTNNLLGVKMVTSDGEIVDIGGAHLDPAQYDWLGLICGSEGQLGVVTEATLRILPAPEGARPMLLGFDTAEAAGSCVSDIIRSGMIPVALEYMDKPAIKVCENYAKAGYPLDVEALLIVEVEGSETEIDQQLSAIADIAAKHNPRSVKISKSPEETAAIWSGRKSAFGAIGQISDYICMDGTIPTGVLPQVLTRIGELSQNYSLQVANIFHAGDGNLHPLILFDANKEGELVKAEQLGADILKLCVEVGGCLTGEHGVGVEKRDLMTVQFNTEDLAQQKKVKTAFDPHWLLNPAKVFPLDGSR